MNIWNKLMYNVHMHADHRRMYVTLMRQYDSATIKEYKYREITSLKITQHAILCKRA